MKAPLSWLREHAPVGASPTEIAAAFVRAGFEIDHVIDVGEGLDGVVVGEVLGVRKVEGSDKLSLVDVTTGDGEREIVCGASNYVVGDRVPVALPGAELPGGFRIAERKVFGVVSHGMLCSARELGLGDDHGGILLLDRDAALGTDVPTLLGLPDAVFDIAVNPDRGYGLSVRGLARELGTAYGVAFSDPAGLPLSGAPGDGGPAVTVDDTTACPRYLARVVRGLDTAAASPLWLRRRVTLCGMRPVSLAVDVTNYVLLGLGQPLHAFDLAKLRGGIVVRRARADEVLVTLDGVTRVLDPEDLVIADDRGPIALAGVMGGAETEVDATTSDILLEAACFDPVAVSRTARRHRLHSEAAHRFERGVDPDLPPAAAELATQLLVQLAGATGEPAWTDVDHRKARPQISLAVTAPGRLAGRTYEPAVVRQRLTDVGCEVSGDDVLTVTPASWRPDLVAGVDLVEEVIRLEGYETLPSIPPPAPAGNGLTRAQRLRRRAGRALAAYGLVENVSYPFVGAAALAALGLPEDDARRHPAPLANPLSEEESGLRTTLLPGLLQALARNVSRGMSDVAVFEQGAVYLPTAGQPAAPRVPADVRPDAATLAALDAALPAEPRHVAVAMTGLREPAGWWGPGRPAEWSDAVAALRAVGEALGVALETRQGQDHPYHPGRCAELVVDGVVAGHAGELHPRVVAALGLPERTVAGELDLDVLLVAADELRPAPEMSNFPPALVDVALVVADDVPAAAVEAALRDGAGPLLEDVRLFDVFRGAQVGEGHQSLAFSLRFRALDTTLTDEVVNGHRDAAVAEAAARTGAVLRT